MSLLSSVTKKTLRQILLVIYYEIKYNIMGLLALLDDWVSREKDTSSTFPKGSGRIALITGGTQGIGAEVIRTLLKQNLHIIIGCRNIEVGNNLYTKIKQEGINSGSVAVFQLDLNSFASIHAFAKTVKASYSKINILINNAGIMFGQYKISEDGYESQFATNYLGHFLLTHLLLPLIIAGGEMKRYARIVNVSSCAHKLGHIDFDNINEKEDYIPSVAYAQSKLAQVLFSNYLNMLMRDSNRLVGVYSVHPGLVNTNLFKNWYFDKTLGLLLRNIFFKTPRQGSISIVYTCLAQKLEVATGTYISNSQITPMASCAYSNQLQAKLFEFTKKELNIKEFGQE